MNDELEDLYQSVILDHSRRPRNFGELTDGAVQVHGDNPSCGDEIDLSVKFGAEGVVEDLKFKGQGCAISQASASLMTMKLKGKSEAEARAMLTAFHDLVTTEVPGPPRLLGDLRLLSGVRKFPQRVKCAMLSWRAFEQALEGKPAGAFRRKRCSAYFRDRLFRVRPSSSATSANGRPCWFLGSALAFRSSFSAW